MRNVLRMALFCFGVGVAAGAGAQVDHLVLSEIGIDPVFEDTEPVSQYVEIYNPTTGTIALDNYFLADTNLYTSVTLMAQVNTGTSDNIIKFPTGFTLAPSQLAVVTHNAERFVNQNFKGDLSYFTNLQKSPLLFELEESRGDVPNMVSYNTAQTTDAERLNFDLAKAREFVVLFHWNGSSDLVQDVDIVTWMTGSWGGEDTFESKGPHIKGADGSQYLVDAGNHSNLSVAGHTLIKTRTWIMREVSEVTSGGNGITGNDESTEYAAATWTDYETHTKSPGLTELVPVGENAPPFLSNPNHGPFDPSSTEPVKLSVRAGDQTTVTLFVDTGVGFVSKSTALSLGSYSATLDPLPDDTIVKYYFEAVDNEGAITRLPKYAPMDYRVVVVDDTPVVRGDIVISEIMHTHIGDDRYEFVEFYNTRSTPINMAYYRFWNSELEHFTFPDPSILPGNGYIVATRNAVELREVFSIPEHVQVLDWGRFPLPPVSGLSLAHPNHLSLPMIWLTENYQKPWPTADWEAGHKSLNFSLISNTVTVEDATPGLPNPIPSSVAGWEIY